jgi:hypothetical protein
MANEIPIADIFGLGRFTFKYIWTLLILLRKGNGLLKSKTFFIPDLK